jgi:hypothetical protein
MMQRALLLIALLLIPSLSWAQGLPLKDGNSSTLADVETCGSTNCVKATGPVTPSGAGYEGLVGISGDSPATSGGRRFNPIHATEGGGIRIGVPQILWDDTFNATSQNTAKYRFGSTTMTGTQSGGYLILNSGTITNINTNAAMQTFKTFPLFAKQELRLTVSAMHTTAPQANATTEWGFFTMGTLPNATAPTDGCFFRFNSAAEFRGVCSYNTTEVQTSAITATSANVNHDYTIVVQTNTVVFYVDNAVVGTLTLSTDAPTLGQPFIQASIPITFRHINGGSAPSLAMQFKVSDVFVIAMGPTLNMDWPTQKSGFGHMASQGQNGGTMGTTALYANSSNPAATVPTNTTAALGTGLGGKFQETLTLAAGTDGIISSYQNPLGGVNQTPRNLVVRGVCVGGVVTVALTTSPLAGVLSLAYGHTAVSLATTETASFATPGPTTKAARRIAIGTTSVASATAAAGTPVVTSPSSCLPFMAPIVVAPGEFIAVAHNKVTTAPATGAVMWSITFDAYME